MGSKDLKYYQTLPYTRRALPMREAAGDRYWLAEIIELPGCKTDGRTQAEAMANLNGAFDEYIIAKLEWKTPIPEPVRERHAAAVVEMATARQPVVAQEFPFSVTKQEPEQNEWQVTDDADPKDDSLAATAINR